ncbi:glycosyltransferase domain protein [Bacteroides fragilis str. DS-71]|nr:glycosyltransferase domain protein [Bacteroides fragilis str. DS-71]
MEGEMKLYSFYSEALEMFDLTLLNDRKIIDYKNAFVVRSLKSLYFPGCEQKSFCEKYNYLKILSDRVTPHFSYGESLLWKSMLRLLRYRLLLLTHICCACLGGIKKAKLE